LPGGSKPNTKILILELLSSIHQNGKIISIKFVEYMGSLKNPTPSSILTMAKLLAIRMHLLVILLNILVSMRNP